MTPTPHHDPAHPNPPAAGDETTGLSVLPTWPALYIFVVVIFITWVSVLYALTRKFS